MAAIALRDVSVTGDGGAAVLTGVDLDVADGERLVLLGASGSGKTTVLRVIAGLRTPTAGSVRFDGRDVTEVPTRERNLAMIFEAGGLQPHMTGRRNIGFPLRLRGFGRREVERRVEAESRALSLEEFLDRRPAKMAAGERHAVMTARALVRATAAILLDEPFAPLEPAARASTRRTLVTVQEGYGSTLVLATHDQEDAMAIAQRLAVLRDGRIEGCAPPLELYTRPPSAYVGAFVGVPAMRLLRAVAWPLPDGAEVAAGSWRLRTTRLRPGRSRRLTLGVRPEHMRLTDPDDPGPRFRGVVRGVDFLGARSLVRAARPGEDEIAALVTGPAPAVGDEVALRVDPRSVHVFDDVTGEAVAHGL